VTASPRTVGGCRPGTRRRLAAHEAMAAGLEVRCSIHVEHVCVEANRVLVDWPEAHGHEAGRLVADAVIVTVPVPQAAALLGGDVFVPSIVYLPTLSLMVALDRGAEISPSGGLQVAENPVWSFIGDNQAKGTSTVSVVTFHSTSGFAATAWTYIASPRPATATTPRAR